MVTRIAPSPLSELNARVIYMPSLLATVTSVGVAMLSAPLWPQSASWTVISMTSTMAWHSLGGYAADAAARSPIASSACVRHVHAGGPMYAASARAVDCDPSSVVYFWNGEP